MLSENLINDIANYIVSRVAKAEIVIDGVTEDIQILKAEATNNLVRIFTNTSKGKGTITDLTIKDSGGNILISKPRSVIKNSSYSLVSTFYIRITEVEVENSVNILEMGRI